jgi:hypothetical protein
MILPQVQWIMSERLNSLQVLPLGHRHQGFHSREINAAPLNMLLVSFGQMERWEVGINTVENYSALLFPAI